MRTGTFYDADKQSVLQSILSFTTGQPSEDYIKFVTHHNDRRRSMTTLRDHFLGKVNTIRRIAEAERLMNLFHYKNELSLTFESSLTKFQNTFNIYENKGLYLRKCNMI